jgi:VCBS repeat-containing protein
LQLIGTIQTGPYQVTSTFVAENYVYVGIVNVGLEIFGISNSNAPIILGTFSDPLVNTVTVQGSYAYLGDKTTNGTSLTAVNITNPATPTLAGSPRTLGYVFDIKIAGSYAYAADYSGGVLDVFDISNVSNPKLVGSYPINGEPFDIALSATDAFFTDPFNGNIYALNVSDPTAPRLLNSYQPSMVFAGLSLPGTPVALALSGHFLYLTNIYTVNPFYTYGRLEVLDVSNPSSPVLVGSYGPALGSGMLGVLGSIKIVGNYAYVTATQGYAGELLKFDISNPTNPQLVQTLNLGAFVSEVPDLLSVEGNRLYVGLSGGVAIVDIGSAPPTIDTTHSVLSGTVHKVPSATGSNAPDYAINGSGARGGVIAFSDPNAGYRPTGSIDTAQESLIYHGPRGQTYSLKPSQIAAIESGFSITPGAGNTNIGDINWNYQVTNSTLNLLGTGETITLTVPVIVDDHNGGTATANITITIDGANDNPVASPDFVATNPTRTLQVGGKGVLSNDSDPNIHDVLTVSQVNGSSINVGRQLAGKYGTLTLNADGSFSYVPYKSDSLFERWPQFSNDGDLFDDFTYAVSDGHGGTATSQLDITVQVPLLIDTIVAGFDTSQYPGDSTMGWLRQHTNLDWVGYYLYPAPSRNDQKDDPADNSWMGHRATLEAQGWRLAPIYLGEQDPIPRTNNSTNPSVDKGTADGNEAAALMTSEGFSPGSVVYLDVESGAPLSGNEQAYLKAWVAAVKADHFTAGVYAPATDGKYVPEAAVFWAAKPIPAHLTSSTAFPTPNPSQVHNATALQYDQGVNGKGIAVSTPFGTLHVDLDSARIAGTQHFAGPFLSL